MMVRIREPLTAQQLETTTERWLVIDPPPAAAPHTVSVRAQEGAGLATQDGTDGAHRPGLSSSRWLGPKGRRCLGLPPPGNRGTGKRLGPVPSVAQGPHSFPIRLELDCHACHPPGDLA